MSARADDSKAFEGPDGAQVPPAESPAGLDQDVQEARDAIRAAAKALQKPADALAALFEVFGEPSIPDREGWAAAFGDQADTVEMLLRGEISNKGLAQVTLRMIAKDVQGIATRLLAAQAQDHFVLEGVELDGAPGKLRTVDAPPASDVELDAVERVEDAGDPVDRYWSSPAGALESGELHQKELVTSPESEEADVEFPHLHEIAERLAEDRVDRVQPGRVRYQPPVDGPQDLTAEIALAEDRADRLLFGVSEIAASDTAPEETDAEFLHRVAGVLEADPDDVLSDEAWRLHEIAEQLAILEQERAHWRAAGSKVFGVMEKLLELEGELDMAVRGLGSPERDGG